VHWRCIPPTWCAYRGRGVHGSTPAHVVSRRGVYVHTLHAPYTLCTVVRPLSSKGRKGAVIALRNNTRYQPCSRRPRPRAHPPYELTAPRDAHLTRLGTHDAHHRVVGMLPAHALLYTVYLPMHAYHVEGEYMTAWWYIHSARDGHAVW